MHDSYQSIPYLHHSHRSDSRAIPRQLPPTPDADLLSKPQSLSPNKKPGLPKGKGAVRAKSGCYTCRIRRKKCDETHDSTGSCQTCIRLRLECLGFGAKRPDWMRENNSVPELREKIKQFLASQGMIKGHSGSGSRNSAEGGNGPMLMLSEQLPVMRSRNTNSSNGSSGPSSPQSPPSATTTSPHHTYPHIVTSALRDAPVARNGDSIPYSPLSPDTDSYHSPVHYSHTTLPPINSQSSLHTHNLLHPVNDLSYMPSYNVHSQQHGDSNGSSMSPSSQLQHHHPMSPMTPIHSSHSFPDYNSPPMQSQTSPISPPPPPPPSILSRNNSSESHPVTNFRTVSRELQRPTTTLQSVLDSRYNPKFEETNNHGDTSPVSGHRAVVRSQHPFQSTLSPLYTAKFEEPEDHDYALSSPGGIYVPSVISILPDSNESYYINYYMKEVLCRQYLLADTTIAHFLYHFAATSKTAKDSMCLLSSLHMHCMRQLTASRGRNADPPYADDINRFYKRVQTALEDNNMSNRGQTEGDAMAALHIVSSFLFSGGGGPWAQYLDIALDWVRGRLREYAEPTDALLNASASERFIIRTTMWFDVWGSITQVAQPRLLDVYRKLFGNANAYIDEDPFETTANLNMMNIVGCSNTSFRAMAEIATLANWKAEEHRYGKLSTPQLVSRGLQIEEKWLRRTPENSPQSQQPATDIHLRREIVANVFQASARVYLHMVLSKGFPNTPEIKLGVEETILYLRQVPTDETNTRAVVRSVVFAICICGCLTQDEEQFDFFLQRLGDLGEEANVFGNCRAVKHLMQRVWALRHSADGSDVDWREVMRDTNGTLLLV